MVAKVMVSYFICLKHQKDVTIEEVKQNKFILVIHTLPPIPHDIHPIFIPHLQQLFIQSSKLHIFVILYQTKGLKIMAICKVRGTDGDVVDLEIRMDIKLFYHALCKLYKEVFVKQSIDCNGLRIFDAILISDLEIKCRGVEMQFANSIA